MSILITGGAGYIGSHTLIELTKAGHDVVVVDNLRNSKKESLTRVEKIIGKPVKFYEADVRDKEALRKILIEPDNSITKQYKALFGMDNVELIFEDSALDSIVDEAEKMKLGARGLRNICEKVLRGIMYEYPSNKSITKIIVDADFVKKNLMDIVVFFLHLKEENILPFKMVKG